MYAIPGVVTLSVARTGQPGSALILFLGASRPNPAAVMAFLALDKAKILTIADAQVPVRFIPGFVHGAEALGLFDGRRRGIGILTAGCATMFLGFDKFDFSLPLPLDDFLPGLVAAFFWIFLHIIAEEDFFTFSGRFDLGSSVFACSGCFGDIFLISLEEHSVGESPSITFGSKSKDASGRRWTSLEPDNGDKCN